MGLKLNDLYSFYKKYTEHYNRYDDEYVYVFFESESYPYTVKISSKSRLFDEGKVLDNVDITGIEIIFR